VHALAGMSRPGRFVYVWFCLGDSNESIEKEGNVPRLTTLRPESVSACPRVNLAPKLEGWLTPTLRCGAILSLQPET